MQSPLTPANQCQSCHPRHFSDWEQSYHSKSVVAMFAGFKKYITTQEAARGRALNRDELMGCLGCHAPAMRFAADADVTRLVELVKTDQRDALAGLSVDCIACHGLVGSGHPDVRPPAALADQTYYSSIENPIPATHKNQYIPLAKTSEFCQSCHTFVTPTDMKVHADWEIVCSLTYDAWAAGPHGPNAPAANQKQCQSCHMEKLSGKAADLPEAPVRQVSGHKFPGWHDAAHLQAATQMSLAGNRTGGNAQLTVTINNLGGHRLPDT
jgi:hypothetical protein